jgi:hypothetical protein
MARRLAKRARGSNGFDAPQADERLGGAALNDTAPASFRALDAGGVDDTRRAGRCPGLGGHAVEAPRRERLLRWRPQLELAREARAERCCEGAPQRLFISRVAEQYRRSLEQYRRSLERKG